MPQVDEVVSYSFYEDEDQSKPLVTKDAAVVAVHEDGSTVDLKVTLVEASEGVEATFKDVGGVTLNEGSEPVGNTYQVKAPAAE